MATGIAQQRPRPRRQSPRYYSLQFILDAYTDPNTECEVDVSSNVTVELHYKGVLDDGWTLLQSFLTAAG